MPELRPKLVAPSPAAGAACPHVPGGGSAEAAVTAEVEAEAEAEEAGAVGGGARGVSKKVLLGAADPHPPSPTHPAAPPKSP